nr:MAG TPA: hypothetical protein [Caudoviricetes sp.]
MRQRKNKARKTPFGAFFFVYIWKKRKLEHTNFDFRNF